jgi:hypothetical protein
MMILFLRLVQCLADALKALARLLDRFVDKELARRFEGGLTNEAQKVNK